jgi:hypothetical protein
VLQKWRNFEHFWLCSYGCQTAGHGTDEKLFRNVANRRDGCTIAAVFEVKKEIPIKVKKGDPE